MHQEEVVHSILQIILEKSPEAIMKTRALLFLVLGTLMLSLPTWAQIPYRTPDQRIVDIVEKPPTPVLITNPCGGSTLLLEFTNLVDLKWLAQPMLKLAGLRILPKFSCTQRFAFVQKAIVKNFATGKETVLAYPSGQQSGRPQWSNDGKRLAVPLFGESGVSLWVFDAATGTGKELTKPILNDILVSWCRWEKDSKAILVAVNVPQRGEPPQPPAVPGGPLIDETSGKVSKLRTYQDLLKTPHDDELFEYYTTTQLARVSIETGEMQPIGRPDVYTRISSSPDGTRYLVDRLKKPFSRMVPVHYFAHVTEVWDANGTCLHTIADLPAAEDLPIQGVPRGPRSIHWQPRHPATLVWSEALDDGDPNKKVPFREKIMTHAAPFTGSPREICRLPERFADIVWLETLDQVLLTDYDRDKKWVVTRLFDVAKPVEAARAPVIFSRSENDEYANPGEPVFKQLPDGDNVAILDKGWMYYAGDGATPDGERPFLRRFQLATGASQTLFLCASGTYESFLDFTDDSRRTIVTSFETPTQVPNYYLRSLRRGRAQKARPFTQYPDPTPELTSIKKEPLKYTRNDGVPLSGMLYYPVDYVPGKKVPVVLWAYPLEYVDAKTAGQVRVTGTRYPKLSFSSVLFFLLRGYAVLYDAEIPIIGEPATANDTFIEQASAGAQAACNALVAKGICDPDKIGVTGHSYGANMVAHLLAHTDCFAAGIARSGAYNRTMTPFGFQGERRTFWEVPDIYLKLSPFTHAHKINEPILMIHGELDENSGTFLMQSERLHGAVRGAGGKSRLVVLPYEGHGYRAKESVLHVLAEMFDWFDTHVKNGRRTTPSGKTIP
jgi:dipeptidyl aminopeptidase/acylaminoacyl peptidase